MEGIMLLLTFTIFIGLVAFILFKLYKINPDLLLKIFNYSLLFALFIVLSISAVILGQRTEDRGREKFRNNLDDVKQIWGGDIEQLPPAISYNSFILAERQHWKTGKPYKVKQQVRKDIKIKKSDINVTIKKDIRKKGLQLYNGYTVYFTGKYQISNPLPEDKTIFFHFPLPNGANNITDTKITVNDREYTQDQQAFDGLDWQGFMKSGSTTDILISYKCQGLDSFRYSLDAIVREIPDFKLTVTTDFYENNINYVANSMVHTDKKEDKNGNNILIWKASNLITRQPIALSFETGIRTDQIISRLYYYSPLAIFFFLAILLVFSIAYKIKLHIMHFIFFGAGFLFFYFFLSYIVSYTSFIPGFLISSLLSSSMLLYYAIILKRGKTLVQKTALGLLMFQVFFSFTFYFPMHTGFLILIGSAITLTVIMKATAGIEWKGKF